MTERDSHLREVMTAVAMDRQKGDSMQRLGRTAAAEDAYRSATQRIEYFLDAVSSSGIELQPEELAELYGVRGGLLRRYNQLLDALGSYEAGARFERAGNLASTYNRTNAIKLALLIGDRTLSELREEINDAAASLHERLQQDEQAADDAWIWADLGDVRLLQGDGPGAEEAYSIFVRKATSGSPAITLAMLEKVVAALDLHADPSASQVRTTIERVRPLLSR
jgi:tetratricopeptide (TPR) repeat protein